MSNYVNLLAKFNISVETDPTGLVITDIKETSSPNVMFITAKSVDGTVTKSFFTPMKTIKEGLANEVNGTYFIAAGHNIWTTADGQAMCTKSASRQTLSVKS